MPRKTEFELETMVGIDIVDAVGCKISIIGKEPENSPYASIDINGKYYFIKDRDLERFAVNILKALGSKKLAMSQRYNSKDFFRKKKNPTHG